MRERETEQQTRREELIRQRKRELSLLVFRERKEREREEQQEQQQKIERRFQALLSRLVYLLCSFKIRTLIRVFCLANQLPPLSPT